MKQQYVTISLNPDTSLADAIEDGCSSMDGPFPTIRAALDFHREEALDLAKDDINSATDANFFEDVLILKVERRVRPRARVTVTVAMRGVAHGKEAKR